MLEFESEKNATNVGSLEGRCLSPIVFGMRLLAESTVTSFGRVISLVDSKEKNSEICPSVVVKFLPPPSLEGVKSCISLHLSLNTLRSAAFSCSIQMSIYSQLFRKSAHARTYRCALGNSFEGGEIAFVSILLLSAECGRK